MADISEYDCALDELLRAALKTGGVISLSSMWNAAINAPVLNDGLEG